MRLIWICFAALLVGFAESAVTQDTPCCSADEENVSTDRTSASPLEQILSRLQKNALALTSCTSQIEYLFVENPDFLGSQTLRKGQLFYLKSDGRSRVRIEFHTLKQDDFDEEQRREVYLFDGVWLTKVDFALEQIDRVQQAPEDEPVDALDYISHRFPLVGFSGSKQFDSEFDVQIAEAQEDDDPNLIHLILDVREDSRYHKDYEKVDFWIDNNLFLPRRVRALSTQDDIYDIRFAHIQTNKKMEKQTFTIETPAHFRKNIEPLKQEPQMKGQD
ncbi:MAG TPA: hypothetical protein ENN97_01045 [Phycisphaerales bacterium]|nr:hypothetical protein [Phycisphaerales bacterium]